MRVTQLELGWITSPAGIWLRDDPLDRQLRFPVPAYLLETAQERILVDTGPHPDAVRDRERRYGGADALGPVAGGQRRRAGRPRHAHARDPHAPALRPRRRARPAAGHGSRGRAAARVGGGA